MIALNEKYYRYMDGILSLNEKVNLTAITDREEFIIKHFYDSLMVTDYMEYARAEKIIDVGTGAGFPGIPLAIFSPEKKFTLMDSLNKRIKIISDLAAETGIDNVEILHARAEELGHNKDYRESFDLCVSRAVANLATLSEYCLPFIKPGGFFMAYKGPEPTEEIEDAKKAIGILGGEIIEVRHAELTEYGLSHNIVVIKKNRNTPKKYPRKSGTPSKEPIR